MKTNRKAGAALICLAFLLAVTGCRSSSDEAQSVSDAGVFHLRDALDREQDNATLEKTAAALDTLSEENFFLVISRGNDFVQVMLDEEAYYVEYADDSGHFSAQESVPRDELMQLLQRFSRAEQDWQQGIDWAEWE